MNIDFKQKIYSHCADLVDQLISQTKLAISSAQESANNESKSTAGDKHDTSRSMMQLEVEQLSKQLSNNFKLQEELKKIDTLNKCERITQGALINTTAGKFFISTSIGKCIIENGIIFCISISSPLYQELKGKKKSDSFKLAGKTEKILEVI